MRERRLILLAFGVLVLVGLLVFWFTREREPEYGGKKLSWWVEQYGLGVSVRVYTSGSGSKPCDEAVRQIGDTAVPYLLRWAQYEMPRWKLWVYDHANPVLRSINASWELNDSRARTRAANSVQALIALGPKGEAEVNALKSWLLTATQSESTVGAAVVLAGFRETGLQALVGIMTNHPPRRVLPLLAASLGWMRRDALKATTALEAMCRYSDVEVRCFATNELRKIDLMLFRPPESFWKM